MQLEFIGAAQTVTGSRHIVRTRHSTVMLDCGLYQGRRQESFERNQHLGVDPKKVTAVVLSHAHIDHSGALPSLAKHGYDGPVFATPATRSLARVMLADAAMIQQSDAKHIQRLVDKGDIDLDRVEPLYTERDVLKVLESMISVPYHRSLQIAPDVKLTFFDAGHVLGSAITALDIDEPGGPKRLLFTGDLGRRNMPILRDPELVSGANILITESTYGDRLHKPIALMEDQLEACLKRVYERGGKVIIPSFALERAQEVVFALKALKRAGRMPPMRVYVDSPLTVKITDVFKMHPECFDEETRGLIDRDESPFDFDSLRYVSHVEDSKALDASDEPAVIISASGMCEAGRVLHHLKSTIESSKNMVLIVGFQAQHTLGRRIVERRPRVRILGVERDLHAEVVVLNGFSAHADQSDLLDFAMKTRAGGPLERVVLVHGETGPQKALTEKLKAADFDKVHTPGPGEQLEA